VLASPVKAAYLLGIGMCRRGQKAMTGGKDWRHRSAPTLVEFEELADLAWRRLPAEFRAMCGDVVIRIEDFPTEEVLDELKLESPFDLMGLYHGVSLDKKSFSDLPRLPDMVFLYRRPLLDVWAEGNETLGDLVTHVLVHEIGHHFGLSDRDMAVIEESATDTSET
jgi:predicted Zn-dependent protease with MMP-like domain